MEAGGAPLFDGLRVSPLKRGFYYFGGTTTTKGKQPRGVHCGRRVTFVSAVARAGSAGDGRGSAVAAGGRAGGGPARCRAGNRIGFF